MNFNIINICYLFLTLFFINGCNQEYSLNAFNHTKQPLAQKGYLDLRQWDLIKDGPIKLKGEWEFYWKTFQDPVQLFLQPEPTVPFNFIQVPGDWSKQTSKNTKFPSYGYATYRLTIFINNPKRNLALRVRTVGSSFKAFINGIPLCSAGKIGHSKTETVPLFSPQLASFTPQGNKIEIVFHVANFHHRVGGLRSNVYFGIEKDLYKIREKNIVFHALLFGGLLIMGLYHLGLFLLRPKDYSPLYFSLFCFLMSIRIIVTGEYYIIQLFPSLSFTPIIRTAYITFYLGVPIFLMFLHALFPFEFSTRFLKFFKGLGLILSLFVLFTSPALFSNYVQYYQVLAICAGLYSIFVILQAIRNKREGAIIVGCGFAFIFLTSFIDILLSHQIIQSGNLTPLGLFLFFFSQAFLLSIRFTKALTRVENLELKYRHIFENAIEGIYQTNQDGRFLSANQSFCTILGYDSFKDLTVSITNITQQLFVDRSDCERMESLIKKNGFLKRFETQVFKKNKKKIWILMSGRIVTENPKSPPFYEGMLLDITIRKEKEKLHRERDRAEAATQAKSEFLANMSHEIRTPINAIIGFTELTRKTHLSPKQSDYLNKVHISSKALLSVVNDVLDFSKIEADKLEIEHIHFNLDEVLENVLQMFFYKAAEKGVELIFPNIDDMPNHLEGDPHRLSQILINLTNNALKFTENGEIVIQVKIIEESKADVTLQFSIRDTGIGIPKSILANLFKPFTQANSFISRNYGGSGLGLYICMQLVNLMEGQIWAESVENQGSTFYFILRFKRQLKDQQKNFHLPQEIQGLSALVVDDNLTMREIMDGMLTSLGFDVSLATSGFDALAKLEQTLELDMTYHLILLDWRMPDINGNEVAKQIKTMETYKDVPIIMISAFADQDEMKRAEAFGINAFLNKPIKKKVLVDTILNVFKDKKSGTNAKQIITKEMVYVEKIKGAHILVVDDSPLNLQLITEILNNESITVDTATNGLEAIEAVNKSRYDAVLMDVQMPVMNGLEATSIIRKNPQHQELPIISLTAQAVKGDQEKSLAAGLNDYITKPVHTERLFQTLSQWIIFPQGKKQYKQIEASQFSPHIINKDATQLKKESFPDHIPGIDVPNALTVVRGNQILLCNLLGLFIKMNFECDKKVERAVNAGEFENAIQMVHRIKGEAGSLSALPLQTKAGDLENILKHDHNDEIKLNNSLMAFQTALKELFESIINLENQGLINRQEIKL